ncbi:MULTISPECIES: Hg(II)-responsive transcriptional regulator [Bacillaceae]|jgi:MerR family transcriptional regulator, mercuric resistance operon regulatory protein|nr:MULTISPECIES: Hg(II)-responsive transcriptional regulator [Bacillaceae]
MYGIGELAKNCGINKETVRYYERVGLLKNTPRTNAGYRMFTEESVKRIKFIKRFQELGFTLSEISKLLGVVDKDDERCLDMYSFVVDKIAEVRAKIGDLKRIEQMLLKLEECCPDNKAIYECPIIETLDD